MDWHEQWSTVKQQSVRNVDFKQWKALIEGVDQRHFVPNQSCGSAQSFGSEPDFDPNIEKIIYTDTSQVAARVDTEVSRRGMSSPSYHVFELSKDDGDIWRISVIINLLYPPDSLCIDEGEHDDIRSKTNSCTPLIDPSSNLKLDENILFAGTRHTEIDGSTHEVRVSTIGQFVTNSGLLGILDIAYDIYKFEPLDHTVNPGSYPVEVTYCGDRVAGIRILFDQGAPAVQWRSAKTASGNGIYGVDAGNLAIFDVEGLFRMSRLDKEKLFNQWAINGNPSVHSMTDRNDCVITSSGYGDGSYPAMWGLDSTENVVSLFIDFMVLVKEMDDEVYESV